LYHLVTLVEEVEEIVVGVFDGRVGYCLCTGWRCLQREDANWCCWSWEEAEVVVGTVESWDAVDWAVVVHSQGMDPAILLLVDVDVDVVVDVVDGTLHNLAQPQVSDDTIHQEVAVGAEQSASIQFHHCHLLHSPLYHGCTSVAAVAVAAVEVVVVDVGSNHHLNPWLMPRHLHCDTTILLSLITSYCPLLPSSCSHLLNCLL